MQLKLQPLTATAFARYGQVIDAGAVLAGSGRAINHGSSLRLDMPGALDVQREGGSAVVAVFRAQPRPIEGPWTELERHRLGSQTFIALAGARCVLLVAKGVAMPDPTTLAAFEVHGQQAYTLHAGTWHHGLIARDAGDFVVIERGAAKAVDCDIAHLAHPVTLAVA